MKSTDELTAAEWAYQHGRGIGEYLCEMATTIGWSAQVAEEAKRFFEEYERHPTLKNQKYKKLHRRVTALKARLESLDERLQVHDRRYNK